MISKEKFKKPNLFMYILFIIVFFILFAVALFFFFKSPVDSESREEVTLTLKSGTSTKEMANILKENDLIRNPLFFSLYVKIFEEESLKAGIYLLSPSMSMNEIVDSLVEGSNISEDTVSLTFKEGQWIIDYAKTISENTNITYDEVINLMKDKEYINELINKYWFLTPDILNENIYYPLEGYLAPNTYFFKDKDVELKEIINTLLDQSDLILSKYKNKIDNVHYTLSMASMAEMEATKLEDMKMIVGVFNNRLNAGMNIGSDVTTHYAIQSPFSIELTVDQLNASNPYNTRAADMSGKMPVGPVCNVSEPSINAAVNPTINDNYFFVADKNGKIYFTKTYEEHLTKIEEIKSEGNWIW